MKNTTNILHEKFIALAKNRKLLLNKMLALLPEIYESGIYKKYASDIYEYCGKFGGIGKSTVEKRLRIEKDLINKPKLREAIEKVGIHKVALVSKLATPQTDAAIADKVKNMSLSSIALLSKELRNNNNSNLTLFDSDFSENCQAQATTLKIELDEEMTFAFLKLKNKFGKEKSNKEILKMILDRTFQEEFQNEKLQVTEHFSSMKNLHQSKKDVGRYIPTVLKRAAQYKSNHYCAYPGCNKPGEIFHHTERFSVSKNHDQLAYLCQEHHEFAHNGLIANESSETSEWKINLNHTVENSADILYREHRSIALH